MSIPQAPQEQTAQPIVLPIRTLAEFMLRGGSLDRRFTGFDRANEGARLHRKLQREASRQFEDYRAEVALKEEFQIEELTFRLEGRADGVYTDTDGILTVDEIKTTALRAEAITGEQSPEHWAQGMLYATILARQQGLAALRVRLTYYQVDEETTLYFTHLYQATELEHFAADLLRRYAPWARRAAAHKAARVAAMRELPFPFASFRAGQRAMISEVYRVCQNGGQLLCQAPTGIGKTISVLYPALKALDSGGPVFYLTARGTTRQAAADAIALLRQTPELPLRTIVLTARDKLCPNTTRECTPEACPYANGYYDRLRDALWHALDAPLQDAATLLHYAEEHRVCPFELGLDASLWCDVVVGDYNYLFDPVVHLARFFEGRGDYLFLVDEAHNLPDRARAMHSVTLCKSKFLQAKKALGKPRSRLKNALSRVNECFTGWRQRCAESAESTGARSCFVRENDPALQDALLRLCEPLQQWLDDHRDPSETHTLLLELYFDVRSWLRVAEDYDDHYIFQASAPGQEVYCTQLCLDPSAFLAADFAKGHAAVLFSATLAPARYYKDLCGLEEARAVTLRSPFAQQNLGLYCLTGVSTRYKDRVAGIDAVAEALHTMVAAHCGNYLAFFPSYSYLQQVCEAFVSRWPEVETIRQSPDFSETDKADFLARFLPAPQNTLLGFAVMGGIFGEGVDLAGDRLVGVAVVGPGLPQVNPRQEQLRRYFEETQGCGFDYAYRYPGMNRVMQAAGRVIRTPQDRGVVLLLDDRFATPGYTALMPLHWSHLRPVSDAEALRAALHAFWESPAAE